jgi:hypothetical protein
MTVLSGAVIVFYVFVYCALSISCVPPAEFQRNLLLYVVDIGSPLQANDDDNDDDDIDNDDDDRRVVHTNWKIRTKTRCQS